VLFQIFAKVQIMYEFGKADLVKRRQICGMAEGIMAISSTAIAPKSGGIAAGHRRP
jgi:hypothetical protein